MTRTTSAFMVGLAVAFIAYGAPTSSADESSPDDSSPDDSSPDNSEQLYQVKDGDKVDEKTLNGWKTWRALACERCHGAQQEGLVGPALVESLKTMSQEQFHEVLMNGRPEKGMPQFNNSPMVNKNWEGLYAYLKGRSDGRIEPGRLSPIDDEQ
ncbi:MAG TPA: c-type cytochrome [Steroidobacter sp.]|nr:c-type cytochrome [Steroidobacter sp.]